jgi:hypothetical protein
MPKGTCRKPDGAGARRTVKGAARAARRRAGVGDVCESDGMAIESRHLTVHLDRSAVEVYAYASQPTHLPAWAPGLGSAVEQVEGRWYVQTGMGRVGLEFAPPNAFGVLDHDVTLPSGEVVYNPMRVIADAAGGSGGCEVVFTLRRQAGMSDAEYERDAAAVAADLARLKRVVEDGGVGRNGAGGSGSGL